MIGGTVSAASITINAGAAELRGYRKASQYMVDGQAERHTPQGDAAGRPAPKTLRPDRKRELAAQLCAE